MSPGAHLDRLAGALIGRPRATVLVALVIALLATAAALSLTPRASTELLAGQDDPVRVTTERLSEAFGDEPIVVALTGDVPSLLTSSSLVDLLALEGRLARLDDVHAVYGPASFLNQTIVQAEELIRSRLGPPALRADRAARRAVARAQQRGASRAQAAREGEQARVRALGPAADQYREMLVRFGSIGVPTLSNPAYVTAVAYGPHTEPKERLRWMLPDNRHALVVVRPRAGLGDEQVRRLGRDIRAAVAAAPVRGTTVRVTGTPLLGAAVAGELRHELLRLAPIAFLAMALVLMLGLRGGGGRLAALGLVLLASLVTAGVARLAGIGLTPALLAGLPIVAGLTLDYAVQLQARFRAARGDGAGPESAARDAVRAVGPVLALSAAATALGVSTLLLSKVPLINELGMVLAIGALVGVAIVLTLGPLALVAGAADGRPVRAVALPGRMRSPRLGAPARRTLAATLTVLAGAGLLVGDGVPIQSDLSRMAPSSLPELRDADQVQRMLGTVGEVRLAIEAPDVADPVVVDWMRRAGDAARRAVPSLRPGPNIGELLFRQGLPDAATARRRLAALPPYFVDGTLAPRAGLAQLTFGLPLVSVRDQAALQRDLLASLPTPPEGVTVQTAGLNAVAAASMGHLEDGRRGLLLIATAAVVLLLLAVRRRLHRALIPVLAPLMVAGLSAGGLRLAGLELSPLSASLELLVLAVGVEFGLLVEARFQEARAQGREAAVAALEAISAIGGATAVSAAAVAAGFLVLAFSTMDVLSGFGLLAAAELAACWALTIVLVPRLCVMAERVRSRPGAVRRVTPVAECR